MHCTGPRGSRNASQLKDFRFIYLIVFPAAVSDVVQVEVIRTYTAKQPDELSLQVADVVLVSQTVEDGAFHLYIMCKNSFFSCHTHNIFLPLSGWYEGQRLRDGETGWFLAECAQTITCQATIERNMQRMDRLQGLETNV